MFFQLQKVSNENLIKWPHKNKNQTLNDTLQLIQSAAFFFQVFVSSACLSAPWWFLSFAVKKLNKLIWVVFSWVKKYIDVIKWKKM